MPPYSRKTQGNRSAATSKKSYPPVPGIPVMHSDQLLYHQILFIANVCMHQTYTGIPKVPAVNAPIGMTPGSTRRL